MNGAGAAPRGALFDLDGTLLDNDGLVVGAFQHALSLHAGREVPAGEIRAWFGRPNREAFEALAPGQAEALTTSYQAWYREHHDRLAGLFEGTREGLVALQEAGARLGVVTSRRTESALASLKRFGIHDLFGSVVGCDRAARAKPDPEPALRAAAELGVEPGRCLLVGDSPVDLRCGRGAGMATVAVRWSRVAWDQVLAAGPDHVVDRLADLADLLD